MKKVLALLIVSPLVSLLVGCAAAKSENPLTPTVAGPIPGVNITAPAIVSPVNTKIAVEAQPVTLTIGNSSSNSPRAITYLFEVATDANFSNKVFSRSGVSPGGGQTSLRLPDPLATQRTYYWRAKADDGANQSDYSGTANFDVFTPIVIDKPQLMSPANNTTVSSLRPTFTFANAPHSGPVGAITYTVQVSDTDTFALSYSWNVDEQPSQTSTVAPQDGPYSKYLFWRVRATDPTTIGPWSGISAFLTPDPPKPAPGPITPGGPPTDSSWKSCGSTPGSDLVECVHRAVNPAQGSADAAFEVTKRVAWLLRGGGGGLLIKNGGENIVGWKGYSFAAGRICYPDGHIYKVLSDVGGANGPSWQDNGFVDPQLYLPALDPDS